MWAISEESLNSQTFDVYRLPEGLVSEAYQVVMSQSSYFSSIADSWHGFVEDISFVCYAKVVRHQWNCKSSMSEWRHEPWAHLRFFRGPRDSAWSWYHVICRDPVELSNCDTLGSFWPPPPHPPRSFPGTFDFLINLGNQCFIDCLCTDNTE